MTSNEGVDDNSKFLIAFMRREKNQEILHMNAVRRAGESTECDVFKTSLSLIRLYSNLLFLRRITSELNSISDFRLLSANFG